MSADNATVDPTNSDEPRAESAASEPKKPPVQLSDAALEEIKRLRDKKGVDEIVLRVGVKGGGCAGLTYTLTFDTQITEKDTVTEHDGVKLVVDRKSAIFIRGMVLDYSDALIGGGFKFENPNARKSCSCGTSFSA
ncbi:MAG: iron-sulfur cluster assembly accessory protein [Proteobacteria bacterium]|nr:iron-sulfur cluster assembly accessory protein [Pseudomonadota bacterium]